MNASDLERWIHRDPAGRGFLTSFEAKDRPCAGDLAAAAADLAECARGVGIVTGFFVPDAPMPAAETDGPLGSLLLADVLASAGVESFLITDERCAPLLRAAMRAARADCELAICPLDPGDSGKWRCDFWSHPRREHLTHLISVERIGPAMGSASGRDECRNMRGVTIDAWTADLYRLFEQPPENVRTIGIGDGGNEIGMGRYWKQTGSPRPIPPEACRLETDWMIVAGVSDWGAMALAAAVALRRENLSLLKPWTSARMEHVLTRMVADGPSIDGCTFRSEPTVDALPFATYIQPWELIRRKLYLDC